MSDVPTYYVTLRVTVPARDESEAAECGWAIANYLTSEHENVQELPTIDAAECTEVQ